jgi:hypothetical protein
MTSSLKKWTPPTPQLEAEMAHAALAAKYPEIVKPLTIGALEIDDGLDGDVCLTIGHALRGDGPERCIYLDKNEVDALLDWIQRFRTKGALP